jgi:hypothetical protein
VPCRRHPCRPEPLALSCGPDLPSALADIFRAFYDLKPLCDESPNGGYYNWTDSNWPDHGGLSLAFQICGTANLQCVPPYPIEFNRATAIQFINSGHNVGQNCTTLAGDTVPCTDDCEVLGEGPPIITLR